jgi:Domain of unknown function (DUF4394)
VHDSGARGIRHDDADRILAQQRCVEAASQRRTAGADARATKVSQSTAALQRSAFGVDFNPAADRLRVSDAGQNLRHDANPGA